MMAAIVHNLSFYYNYLTFFSVCILIIIIIMVGWLVGWYFVMSTLVSLFHAKVRLICKQSSEFEQLMIIICEQ